MFVDISFIPKFTRRTAQRHRQVLVSGAPLETRGLLHELRSEERSNERHNGLNNLTLALTLSFTTLDHRSLAKNLRAASFDFE